MASGNAAIFLPGANGIDIRSGIAHTLLAVRGASEFRGRVRFLSGSCCATIASQLSIKVKIAASVRRDSC